jgi:hypothetical protein
MRIVTKTIVLAVGVLAMAAPVRAEITADLAKHCRAMMLKAHPVQMYGASGSAAAQRDYFKKCIERQGKVEDHPEPTTSGQSPRK